MNCPKCGTYNDPQSKFCIKCGSPLNINPLNQPLDANTLNQPLNFDINEQPVNNQPINIQSFNEQPMNNQPINIQNSNEQPINSQPINNIQTSPIVNPATSTLNYFMYLIMALIKPFKSFKEEEEKLNNVKHSIILTLIITVIMTLSTLIQTIISTLRVANYSWANGYTYSWEWSNLKSLNWLEVIGKNFLIYAGIILAISAVFYLGSLVVKKQLSFIKSLSIVATSLIPAVGTIMIISPILNLIWSPLSMILTIIGFIYSLLIFYELINSELNLEKDAKIYFNLVCFGILIVAGYFIIINVFMSSIGGLDSVLDLLK